MMKRAIFVLYNLVRFVGKPYGKQLIRVAPSTSVEVSPNAKLTIGSRFTARRNVEINVRGSATLTIGDGVFLNSGCIMTVRDHVSIGDGTIFGPGVMLFDNDHKVEDGYVKDNEFATAPITIGNHVWIGAGTLILKDSVIEDNCIIAAGSVVKGKVEAGSLMVQKRSTTYMSIEKKQVGDNLGEN